MKLVEIDLNLIDEDTEQPRSHFDKASIEELAESIREVGLLNPIKVYKIKGGRYKIVFGNRRYKALKLLGFRKVPCILSDNTDELDIYFEQLTENIQRRDFTPVEEALGFEKLLDGDRWKVSKKYLASRLGKTEKYITNKLSLLVFGPEIRKIIHGGGEIVPGRLSEEQALGLKDVPLEYRDQLAAKVAKDGRSARDVKRIAGLFVSADFDGPTKEKFLKMPCHELVALSIDSERRAEMAKAPEAPAPAATTKAPEAPEAESSAAGEAGSALADAPIAGDDAPAEAGQDELARLLAAIPAFRPLPAEMLATIAALPGEERRKALDAVETALAMLDNHARQWAEVRAALAKDSI